jgi:hypothetical protein
VPLPASISQTSNAKCRRMFGPVNTCLLGFCHLLSTQPCLAVPRNAVLCCAVLCCAVICGCINRSSSAVELWACRHLHQLGWWPAPCTQVQGRGWQQVWGAMVAGCSGTPHCTKPLCCACDRLSSFCSSGSSSSSSSSGSSSSRLGLRD